MRCGDDGQSFNRCRVENTLRPSQEVYVVQNADGCAQCQATVVRRTVRASCTSGREALAAMSGYKQRHRQLRAPIENFGQTDFECCQRLSFSAPALCSPLTILMWVLCAFAPNETPAVCILDSGLFGKYVHSSWHRSMQFAKLTIRVRNPAATQTIKIFSRQSRRRSHQLHTAGGCVQFEGAKR